MPRKSSSVKRARSPDPGDTQIVKRAKALVDTRPTSSLREEARRKDVKEPREERERKRGEREEEFRIKYTRAFPNWVFYFDLDTDDAETAATRKELERMVSHMNAVRKPFVLLISLISLPKSARRRFLLQRSHPLGRDGFRRDPSQQGEPEV